MAFHRLEQLARLREGYQQEHRVAGRHLLLLVLDGRQYLIDCACPHMGVSLARGSITAGGLLRCPGHALEFDLRTGENPKRLCPSVRTYPLAYDGPWLGVDL